MVLSSNHTLFLFIPDDHLSTLRLALNKVPGESLAGQPVGRRDFVLLYSILRRKWLDGDGSGGSHSLTCSTTHAIHTVSFGPRQHGEREAGSRQVVVVGVWSGLRKEQKQLAVSSGSSSIEVSLCFRLRCAARNRSYRASQLKSPEDNLFFRFYCLYPHVKVPVHYIRTRISSIRFH